MFWNVLLLDGMIRLTTHEISFFKCSHVNTRGRTRVTKPMFQGGAGLSFSHVTFGVRCQVTGCPAEKGKVSAPTQSSASLQQGIQLTNCPQFWRPEAQRFRLASPFWLLMWLHQRKPEKYETNCFISVYILLWNLWPPRSFWKFEVVIFLLENKGTFVNIFKSFFGAGGMF